MKNARQYEKSETMQEGHKNPGLQLQKEETAAKYRKRVVNKAPTASIPATRTYQKNASHSARGTCAGDRPCNG